MNKRIKELAEESYNEFYNIHIDLELFAELLIRECATAFEAEVDTWKEMNPYQGSMKRRGTQAIKQHFGVEQ
jgi:hypothetical protein